MKTLELTDGTIIELSDVSERNHYVTVVEKWADIDALNMTADNVDGATFEGELVEDVVFVSLVGKFDGENIVVTIDYRDKTDIENIQDEQAVQNEILNNITTTESVEVVEEETVTEEPTTESEA